VRSFHGDIQGAVVGVRAANGRETRVRCRVHRPEDESLESLFAPAGPPPTEAVFELTGLAAGAYRLFAEFEDEERADGAAIALRSGQRIDGVVVEFPEGLTLRGRVVDRGGGLVAGCVEVFADASATSRVRRGPSGSFEFRGLAEGRYFVRAIHAT